MRIAFLAVLIVLSLQPACNPNQTQKPKHNHLPSPLEEDE
jgi:hypothetical protein